MDILYIHQYFTLPSSAGGTRSYDLAQRFVSAGHKVRMITCSAQLKELGPFTEKWTVKEYDGMELHILALEYSNKQNFAQRIKSFLRFMYEASARVLKLDGDVVLATSTPLTIAVPALIKKIRHKKPFIFEVRDVWPEAPIAIGAIKNKTAIRILNRFEELTYRRSQHIVALSEDMRASILRRTNTSMSKITVIPNIAELNRFSNSSDENSLLEKLIGFKPQRSVLYAGTLGKVNGLKFLVDMAIRTSLADENLVYVVLGDGMEKESVMSYAQEKGVLNRYVFFLNPVPKAQLPQLYAEVTMASSFVIPVKELWANSANKFFDSMAAAKPVLINHEGWQADVIRKYNTGFVFDYRSEHMAEEAMRFCRYVNNLDLLAEQGRNARRLAEEQYSLDVAAANYLKVLEDAV
ncbi:glycosyltransferase family 4 protein [Chitinophagaceae bacterium MMS25-I14]